MRKHGWVKKDGETECSAAQHLARDTASALTTTGEEPEASKGKNGQGGHACAHYLEPAYVAPLKAGASQICQGLYFDVHNTQRHSVRSTSPISTRSLTSTTRRDTA